MSGISRGLLTAALGAAAWSTLVEPQLFTLRRHTLPVLEEGAPPLRVLQLSDLHLAPWQHRKIEWVRSLVELHPDLVVLTGDMMGHRLARGPLLHTLRAFADASIPAVFVHGSNDYYSPIAKNPFVYLSTPSRVGTRPPDLDNEALTSGMTALGFIDLNNRAQRLTLRGIELELIGLNDPHIGYDDISALDASIEALPSAAKPAATSLGVVHAPYQHALDQLLSRGVSAILAGHTHGGQVRVPGVGALTANCDLPARQARGLSVWYDAERVAYLNVSAGLGASVYAPVRFACRPEASLITLEAAH